MARPVGTHDLTKEVNKDLKLAILKIMLNSRFNDEGEMALKRRGQGHFQLSSEGHEALGAIALAMKPEDWLHPHYRDRAIVIGRGVSHDKFFLDYFSKAESPSAGRQMPVHYNYRDKRIVSLSSPVATQLLQAVGMAMSLKERKVPEIVVTAIGDAATREGEALEAFAHAGVEDLPIVFIIEDNAYGISTVTKGKTFWTMKNGVSEAPDGTKWFYGCLVEFIDGLDPIAVYEASQRAIDRARNGKGATILIANVVRLTSHSSSDDQRLYRSAQELKEVNSKDPIKLFCERCIKEKIITKEELDALKASIQKEVEAAIERARNAPEPDPATVVDSAFAPLPPELPRHDHQLPKHKSKRSGGMTVAQCMDLVFAQEMARNERIYLFGEDIEDPKGDVFGTTRGLSRQFPGRVKNSPLAEATIVGTGIGRALLGDLPVAAIQFIDFMGPALNQLYNEVLTMYWRSNGEFNCPMVMMAPYGAYLPGLGPWHSQTNEAIYAHMPGMHVVIPSNPGDAAGLLRYALRCNRPVLYLYPKALLHGAEDTVEEPSAECMVPFGKARVARPGRDVTIVTWGNCVPLCLTAANKAAKEGIEAEVLDLRTMVPWDLQAVLNSVAHTGRLLVVHEDAKTCGMGGEILSEVVSNAFHQLRAVPQRITKTDDHNPYNYTLELAILPNVDMVLQGLRDQKRQDLHHSGHTVAAMSAQAPATFRGPKAGAKQTVEKRESGPAAASSATQQVEIMVPRQSPTDEDATVVKFLVEVGQKVKTGTPLVEMEANKGSFEVESTHEGTVQKLHAKNGERVKVETPLLTIEAIGGPRVQSSTASPHATKAAESAENHASVIKEIALSTAQVQVGALAMKSQLEIPTVSIETEIDFTEIARQREMLKGQFETKFGLKPTFTHLLLYAIVQAMKDPQHEGFRGRLSPAGDKLYVEAGVNLGFAAVGPNENLFSPVVKNAEQLSFSDLCKRVQTLTETVRSGDVNTADLQGATVTLTNIGAFEATSGTPFVIPGQLAMLAAGSLLERPRYAPPDAEGKRKLEPRLSLNLKLVFDHRPFNGSHAAAFLRTIKHQLETLKLKDLL